MNAKIVVIKGPWWKEMIGHLSFLFPYSSLFPSQSSSYHYVDYLTEKRGSHGTRPVFEEEDGEPREEDLSPGGNYIKLLLLPKPFSPDFRINWELYRLEYWEKENERRAQLRQLLRESEREQARRRGGWFWWWAGWQGRQRMKYIGGGGKGDIEKSSHRHQQQHEKEGKRHSVGRSGSHSRNTSRSSTPSTVEGEERPTRIRRGSTTASASERRRKATRSSTSVAESSQLSKLTPVSRPA